MLGFIFKEIRKQKEITQVELSKRTGINQPSISNWERSGVFSLKNAPLVADKLGVKLEAVYAELARRQTQGYIMEILRGYERIHKTDN